MTAVKICCISDAREVELALSAGATALGFVGEQPSGPGRLDDEAIVPLVRQVAGRAPCWLLSSTTDARALAAQVAMIGPDALQICDRVEEGVYHHLRQAFPDLRLVQVVHVAGPEALDEARRVAPQVDAVLLDSGVTDGPERQLGGTGRTHDWSVSARIVKALDRPVWLAGGLDAGNVKRAIGAVGPHGVDLCSGVRDADYRLDAERLRAFLDAVRHASDLPELPRGADLAALQAFVHDLEAHHGWLETGLVENGFLMTEEVGELHAAIRRLREAEARGDAAARERLRAAVGAEIVDVLNYLLAIAHRLELDLEAAFRSKNARNLHRTWD
jgi:phosphoribosylanthranilate isomerase